MSEFSCDRICKSQSAAAAQALSVIGQRLIDAANHPISPVSMETRSGADVQEGVRASHQQGCCCCCFYFIFFVCVCVCVCVQTALQLYVSRNGIH